MKCEKQDMLLANVWLAFYNVILISFHYHVHSINEYKLLHMNAKFLMYHWGNQRRS